MEQMIVGNIPFELTESTAGHWSYQETGGELRARALPKSDLYRNPAGDYESDAAVSLNALKLIGAPKDSDFQLSARVKVNFESDYDAGVLLIWSNASTWAKLCFELSPDKEAMVVSVVTLGASDDVNSTVIPTNEVWLRVSRLGQLYAFHSSTNGAKWSLVRAFTLGKNTTDHQIGFVAQAPIGEGCDVAFDQISYSASTLSGLRNGS